MSDPETPCSRSADVLNPQYGMDNWTTRRCCTVLRASSCVVQWNGVETAEGIISGLGYFLDSLCSGQCSPLYVLERPGLQPPLDEPCTEEFLELILRLSLATTRRNETVQHSVMGLSLPRSQCLPVTLTLPHLTNYHHQDMLYVGAFTFTIHTLKTPHSSNYLTSWASKSQSSTASPSPPHSPS